MESQPEQPEHDGAKPAKGRGVLEGAFALLEELRRVGEARLTELGTRTGLPKATVHRLLTQLSDLGAVEQCAGRYRLGPTIARLDQSRDHHRLLGRASALPLHQLKVFTGATVCVVAPSTDGMTVIHGIPGAIRDFFPHLPGQTLPPDSAADIVMRSFEPPSEPAPGYSSAQWGRRLGRAREHGADVHEYEWGGQRMCLATPVRASSGRVVAAVGVAVADSAHLPATVASARRAALMVSANLQRFPVSRPR
ncbi:helix-turn-helix domain-containing protein [Streptomyces sp. PA5.6]|uniref:helix-turn-helix domain-containing protein n=1 Tax=Streptomyces sp. PA5.6 TaxID=3035651 RepID=UPI0039049568